MYTIVHSSFTSHSPDRPLDESRSASSASFSMTANDFVTFPSGSAKTKNIDSTTEDSTNRAENKDCSDDLNDEMSVDDVEVIQAQPDFHSSTSDAEEIILSVYWRRGMLGAAIYIVETSEIQLLTDIVDVNPEFNMLKSLYNQVQPSHVITSGSMADKFVTTLKYLLADEDSRNDLSTEQTTLPQNKLHLLPKKEYIFEACKRRIHSLKMPTEPEGSNDEEHLLYINSVIAMSAESMVHALGALLTWLDKSWAYLNLDPLMASTSAPIFAISNLSLEDIVTIDGETYEALQIFSQLSHPSNFKMWTTGSSKEGLSIYGIFNRCKSKPGCKFMRVMLLHPTRNMDVLNARMDVIEFCMHLRNEETVKNLLDCLKSIKSVTMIMTKLSAAKATAAEWKTLHKTIYYSIMIGELCANLSNKAPLFQKIAECSSDDLRHVAHCINRIVDFDESELQNKFIVRLGIDEELDRMKLRLGSLPELMNNMAIKELAELPPEVNECSVAYIPEIGYLLAIPIWKPVHLMENDDFKIPGLEFMFKVDQTVHYKSARCRELDATVGDGFLQISGHEARIMIKLVQFVESHLPLLIKVAKLTAELDCLIALAAVARENNYVRPVLTRDRILDIKGGRHPLQEMCVDSFVPNDTLSSERNGLMKILTGPNASGKSVYLKQVALIAYLAHVGSFVPAEKATIGILDHIHTRIQTVESIATRLSAFMIDMRQMSLSLFCSTPSSLIIVDEFGKGTSEVDGLALLASSLKSFLERGEHCPHVFVSTHFHHVTEYLPQSKYLQLQTLKHLVDQDGQIVYLFKLTDGQAQSSFALKVAEMVGLPQCIVDRARQALSSLQSGQPMPDLKTSKRSVQLASVLRCCEKVMSASNEKDFNEIQKCLKDMQIV